MTSLLFTWTGFWTAIGKGFEAVFKIMPGMGFAVNFLIWIIIWGLIFGWIFIQARDTRKAKAEGRLI